MGLTGAVGGGIIIFGVDARSGLGGGLLNLKEGNMIKGSEKVKSLTFGLFAAGIFLCALVLFVSGCGSYAQLGETEAEGHRRHQRNLALNQQQFMADIDTFLLFDEPSKLTDKRIP